MAVRRKKLTKRSVKRTIRTASNRFGAMMDNVANASENLGMLKERSEILKAYTELDGETFQEWLYKRCKV